jgi:ELWxxDGT repeat protein
MGLIKDLGAGLVGSTPEHLTNVNGTLYFSAQNPTSGLQLWKSNGTAAGTTPVKDFPFQESTGNRALGQLTSVNNTLFFNVSDRNGTALWKSDGTAAGTTILYQEPAYGTKSTQLTNVNGTLYFVGRFSNELTSYNQLWKSDGTAAGTVPIDLTVSADQKASPQQLRNVNGALYIQGYELVKADFGGGRFDYVNLYEEGLWKTDGKPGGTVPLLNQQRSPAAGGLIGYNSMTDVNGTLYFTTSNGTTDIKLWKSDGTAASTKIVKGGFPVGSGDRQLGFASLLENVNGTVYFKSYESNLSNGQGTSIGIWKSDGTETGTTLVKSFRANGQEIGSPMVNVNGTLYFTANDNLSGDELWKTDGTAAGTVQVKDIRSGTGGSEATNFVKIGSTLYFTADDGVHGQELWKSDGTAAGTMLVKDIRAGSRGSEIKELTNINGKLYFVADDGVNGAGLWSADDLPGAPRSEIFWRNPNGTEVTWQLDNSKLVGAALINSPYNTPAWSLKGIADMDGDGIKDQIYQNVTTRQLGYLPLTQANGLTTGAKAAVTPTFNNFFGALAGQVATPGVGWELIGIENIAGTAQADLIFYSRSLDRLVYWETNTTGQFVGAGVFTSSLNPGGQGTGAANSWNVEAIADFTGDGKVDILWRNTQGVTVLWKVNGSNIDLAASKVLPTMTNNFELRGVGDFNGDGIQDVVWRDKAANITRFWTFNNTGSPTQTADNNAIVAAGFQIEAIADFDGDRKSDLVWRDTVSDRSVIWNFDLSGTLAGPTFQVGSIRPGSNFIRNFLPGVTNNVAYVNGDRNWDIDAATGI